MVDHKTEAQKLYEVFRSYPSTGSMSMGPLDNVFPAAKNVDVHPRTIFTLTQIVKKDEIADGERRFIYSHYLDKLLQKSIDAGNTEFELNVPLPIGPFPNYVKHRGARVKIAIVGDLGEQAFKAMSGMDIALYGSAGNDFLLFSKDCRAYVTGTVGTKPLFQTEGCELDAQNVGPNVLLAKNGKIIVRGTPPKKLHDANDLIELFDEAAPLVGRISHLLVRLRAKRVVGTSMRESNVVLQCAGEPTKYFRHVDYVQPDWIPKRIFSHPKP